MTEHGRSHRDLPPLPCSARLLIHQPSAASSQTHYPPPDLRARAAQRNARRSTGLKTHSSQSTPLLQPAQRPQRERAIRATATSSDPLPRNRGPISETAEACSPGSPRGGGTCTRAPPRRTVRQRRRRPTGARRPPPPPCSRTRSTGAPPPTRATPPPSPRCSPTCAPASPRCPRFPPRSTRSLALPVPLLLPPPD